MKEPSSRWPVAAAAPKCRYPIQVGGDAQSRIAAAEIRRRASLSKPPVIRRSEMRSSAIGRTIGGTWTARLRAGMSRVPAAEP